MKKVIPILVIIMMFVAGGIGYAVYASSNNSKPDDVSQEVWDRGIQYTIYLNQLVENKEILEDNLVADIREYVVTEKDEEIAKEMLNLEVKTLLYGISLMLGEESGESKNSYLEVYTNLEKTFGKNNLKSKKLDMAFIEESQLNKLVNLEEERKQMKKDFMKINGVTLTGKEVQYDLVNNLDKKFYLEGKVELCDYYNYGYTNESAYFCGKLTPSDGNYSDSWYLYFHRESFNGVYELLLDRDINLRVVAEIPSKAYKRGQDRMAAVKITEGY